MFYGKQDKVKLFWITYHRIMCFFIIRIRKGILCCSLLLQNNTKDKPTRVSPQQSYMRIKIL